MSKKILIVDDDQRIRDAYGEALKTQGYTIATEPNGEKALDSMKEEKPDLVLLDIMMPNIHGLQILEIVKATPETENVKIVIFSALSDTPTKEQAAKLGAAGYLVKSESTMAEVIKTINDALV